MNKQFINLAYKIATKLEAKGNINMLQVSPSISFGRKDDLYIVYFNFPSDSYVTVILSNGMSNKLNVRIEYKQVWESIDEENWQHIYDFCAEEWAFTNK